jgi:HSP20 family protein
MAVRDLIPWSRNQELAPTRGSHDPFMTLHREMNRLFDDVFRGASLSPFMEGQFGWPKIELSETDKALMISAELPGMTENDVQIEIANGVLTIRGEKKSEKNEGRYFTERYYGSFQRQIALEDVSEDKAQASFKNGVLTISLPKSKTRERASSASRSAHSKDHHGRRSSPPETRPDERSVKGGNR